MGWISDPGAPAQHTFSNCGDRHTESSVGVNNDQPDEVLFAPARYRRTAKWSAGEKSKVGISFAIYFRYCIEFGTTCQIQCLCAQSNSVYNQVTSHKPQVTGDCDPYRETCDRFKMKRLRLPTKVATSVVCVTILLFIVGCDALGSPGEPITPTPAPSPTPITFAEDTARAFLKAWSEGDYNAMYTMLAPSRQATTPGDQFVTRYKGNANEATKKTLKTTLI